jgi:2-iminobutanoate/2-iminopropanoate deaminase
MPKATPSSESGSSLASLAPKTTTAGPCRTVYASGCTACPLYHSHPHIEEELQIPEDIKEQCRRTVKNIELILDHSRSSFTAITQMLVYLTDSADKATVLAELSKLFKGQLPPHSVIIVKELVTPQLKIEIEITATGADFADNAIARFEAQDIDPEMRAEDMPFAPAIAVQGPHNLLRLPAFSALTPCVDGKKTEKVATSNIQTQTRRSIQNLAKALEAAGGTLADVLRTTVYLSRIEEMDAMNEVYRESFCQHLPARTCIVVDELASPGIRFEIEALAAIPLDQ